MKYTVTCTKSKTHICIRVRRDVLQHITIGGWARMGEAACQAERDLPEADEAEEHKPTDTYRKKGKDHALAPRKPLSRDSRKKRS